LRCSRLVPARLAGDFCSRSHDFRPHYRLVERIARTLPPNLRLLATTATANLRVMDDLQAVLGPGLMVLRGDLNRPSLALQTIRLPGEAERLAWLAERMAELPGHGIVYTLTVRDAERVAAWLSTRGLDVQAYTSETGERREELEQALLENRVKALVATTALGMGYDKPDLAFVIHYQRPGSVVAYYQQVGRAGRALDAAYGVLLSGREDDDILDWFIRSAFPTRQEATEVIGALEQSPAGLSVPELLGRVNLSKGRVEKTLTLLSLESPAPVAKQGHKWQLTAAPLGETFWERTERLTPCGARSSGRCASTSICPSATTWPSSSEHWTATRSRRAPRSCRPCRPRWERRRCGRRSRSCGDRPSRSNPGSSGPPAACPSPVFPGGSRSNSGRGRAGRSASGATRAGGGR
jgi:hypothetical protein